MKAVSSTELDDAIFPQPPQDVTVAESQDSVLMIKTHEEQEVESSVASRPSSKEKIETLDDLSLEEKQEDEDDKKRKKKTERRKSRIRRLFTGMRLKKNEADSSTEEETEKEGGSSISVQSREESVVGEETATNRTAFTRIIHRVQNKANKMWEQIGHKLGRTDTDDEDTQEETSKESSVSFSELNQSGDGRDKTMEVRNLEETKHVKKDKTDSDAELKDILEELSTDDTSGKGKSGTLRRIASGIKSGFMPKNIKSKN